jgi:hypothetical protein
MFAEHPAATSGALSETAAALRMLVSGGQTGADRAALDWAIDHGITHGGWCPSGRRAEDGRIDERYALKETKNHNYIQRTEWNVRDSDGTVVFTLERRLRGGSRHTVEFAKKYKKPCLVLTRTLPLAENVEKLRDFIAEHQIRVLNVAGSRTSEEPGVDDFVRTVLEKL